MFRPRYENRAEAGHLLAEAVKGRGFRDDVLVYALPRGGVPIGAAVASALGASLDLVLVRKLGVPGQPELAFGAVIDDARPQMVLNPDIVESAGLSESDIAQVRDRELTEIERRRELYFKDRGRLEPRGKTCIVVDDGLATGATAKAALLALRQAGAARLILAVPVAPAETLGEMQGVADEVICLHTPSLFYGVGASYRAFPQLSDADVVALLGTGDTIHGAESAAPRH